MTATEAPAPRVHPGAYEMYPPGTPPLEQLPAEYRNHGFTADSWEAYITHPAITGADSLFADADALADKLAAWLKSYGHMADPGVHAIEAAGLPMPPYLREFGSHMRYVQEQFHGLAWALKTVLDNTRDDIPDTTDEQNAPANIRRLLGEVSEDGEGGAPCSS